jgi:hypothetical protein
MTLLGSFAIEGSFILTGRRGLVIYGDIVDGKVTRENILCFVDGDQQLTLKINDINFIDNISEKVAKVGLTFYYDSEEQKKQLSILKVQRQTAKIISD